MKTRESTPATSTAGRGQRPDLTILLPTYERPTYLETCLKHHVAHFDAAGLDYEILVCDNASGEETKAVVARWCEKSPRVRCVTQPKNLGYLGNFYYGHRHAAGRIVVTTGDDDLLIPESVAAYVGMFDADPELVMVQAPWFVMNERERNKIMGAAYMLDGPVEIARGDYRRAIELVLEKRIFPEVFAIRTDLVPEIIGPADPTAYHFFVTLARAVEAGRVVFSDRPHAIVTGISRHGKHQGNSETASGWDMYRGGLEFLLGRARDAEPDADWSEALRRLDAFVLDRMHVAVHMLLGARAWEKAWYLCRRLKAYAHSVVAESTMHELLSLAAMDAALREATLLGASDVVLADELFSIYLNVIDLERHGVEPICASDWDGARRGRTAFLGMNRKREPGDHPDDIVVDVAAVMRRISI
ncbi:glycosyltransferase family 2 protein [Salinarimonas rosea]|uniref:glycosyltransferase family 2 protein n=1 Tax=Salinarimonas rosea TaxID=552063 RepID=UPI00041C5809|nr:glycosyltransferase family A protein [Salinarimonas rosea]